MSDDVVIESIDKDLLVISNLARKIWMQHFVPIIGTDQVNYMLAKFQSSSALAEQLKEGYEYFVVRQGNKAIGYFGLLADSQNKKLMISKFYLLVDCRGHGIGKRMLDFIEDRSSSLNIPLVWLTVNKYNHDSIAWYLHQGFSIVDEVKADIGSGFYMDDFIMEKALIRR